MRINKFLARATGLSRRAADQAVRSGRVDIDGQPATLGSEVSEQQIVKLDGRAVKLPDDRIILLLNKPAGYVSSRAGQGSRTIYDLLPDKYQSLKPVGRLDKDSSGLLLLTDDGDLANRLAHPRYAKTKLYEIRLDSSLTAEDAARIESGVALEDGTSALKLKPLDEKNWQITMTEGRNRQIRRTFAALGYGVVSLQRIKFGEYRLGQLKPKDYIEVI
jgi:23S rRNA pseudouridine2605 synthase